MRGIRRTYPILKYFLLAICLAVIPAENLYAAEDSKYLDAVREFADNVLKYGRDTYGPKHTPLFVDGLMVRDPNDKKGEGFKPVEWIAPNGDRWILSNLASQQNLFRTLDGLTTITGDPKYRQAAVEAIEYAFANLRSPNGLLYWGVVAAYDAQADKVYALADTHCLKWHYPYYELMWKVNPNATKQFIDSFWSAHILDWSNLDMDRVSKLSRPLGQPWQHKYEGGPIYFQSSDSDAVAYVATGSSLCQAAAILYKLSGEHEPLVWGKRLAHRYVETRNPKIGISGYVYSRMKVDNIPRYLGDDFKGHVLLRGTLFPAYLGWCNTVVRELVPGYLNITPGTPFSLTAGCWTWQLLLGEMLGADGGEFTQWALEELTALGKVAYRKNDNSFIPMLIDGTSLEGYVCKRNGYDGPKGSMFKSIEAVPMDFWAYALAYRITEDRFMWEMARNIALGQDFGDIGISPINKPKLQRETVSSDPFALLSFLELYKKTSNKAFLEMAERIGDNILANRFQKGFFIASARHIYAKFDSFEPLVLLRLHMATKAKGYVGPQIWPHRALFTGGAYRSRLWASDYTVIYALTESLYPPRSLEEAAATGDVGEVKSLISQGVDVDVLSEDVWQTPLHRAAQMGRYKVVELLLAEGADVDMRSCHGATALHFATEIGHMEIAELLIANGADVNATNNRDNTPLYYAARSAYKDIVELLLEKGATIYNIHLAAYMGDFTKVEAFIREGIDVNASDVDGYTPLHFVAKTGHADVAEFLIANGADVNAKNNYGQTPLDIAVSRGHKDIIELFLVKGADTSIHVAAQIGDLARVGKSVEGGANVNAKNNQGMTALHLAVQEEHQDVAKFLITKGADVNAKDKSGYTPLYYAIIWSRDKDMVRILVAKGADVNLKPEKGYLPLHYAVWMKDIDLVKLFVANGAKSDVKGQDGWTAFRWAASQGNRGIVELFVAKGADVSSFHMAACVGDLARVKSFVEQGTDVDAKDELGWTSLYWAVCTGQKEVAEFLIARGADVQAKTNDSTTVIHQAAGVGGRELAELLISKGADANTKDKYGDTPLHSAAWGGNRTVVELLIAKGANVNAKGGNDWTPLYSAARVGHRDVVEILLFKGADVNAKDKQGRTALWYAEQMGYTEIAELLRKHGAKE